MKKNITLILLFLATFISANAVDTVKVKQTQIPILIDRTDNVLFYIRIEAQQAKQLNEVTLQFGEDVNLSEIKAVKLYYGGTEAAQRAGQVYYAPVQYVPSNSPGKTRFANSSYSIKVAEKLSPKNKVVFTSNYNLFPGINYFWISLEMKPKTSLLSKIDVELNSVKLDSKMAPLAFADESNVHRMGYGVRQAGDDGSAAFRIPGLVTSNKGTLLGVYDIRYNSSVDLQEYVEIGVSRSIDKGQTWEPMRVAMSFGEYGGLPKTQNGVGDPSILVDEKTGTI